MTTLATFRKHRTFDQALEQALRDHLEIPDHVNQLAAVARYDLYSGPIVECDECGHVCADCTCDIRWLGFADACRVVSTWADINISRVWYSHECDCLLTSEPDDEDGWEYRLIDSNEIVTRLFGKELGRYL